jgi:tripeptidyl-peptidase I
MSDAALPSSQPVTLKLALVPKDAAKLEKKLISVATPGSSDFRKYLSKQEVTAIVGRSDEEIQRLTHWLEERGVRDVTVHPHR